MSDSPQDRNPQATALEDFRAELEVFSGPLDLLLHLIKQEEVDIFEVAVSRITDRYLAALRTIQFFDVNVAGEFLVVAATLMEIKSKTLLPPGEDEEEDEEDPGVELVRRLLQYKEFKEAAGELEESARRRSTRYSRPRAPVDDQDDPEPEGLVEDLAAWDLAAAFAEVLEQTRLEPPTRILRQDIPVGAYVEEMLRHLRASGGQAAFMDLFRRDQSRERIVGVFLALLELIRRKAILVAQGGDSAETITISLRQEADEQPIG
ncbi:MAG: segregation/condensation protein A [Candidatus Brocadiaceae bacterium]|jgi:segregation and condensation protein A